MALALVLGASLAFDFDDEEEVVATGGPRATSFGDDDSGSSVQLMHAVGDVAPSPRGKLFLKPTKGVESSGGRLAVRVALPPTGGLQRIFYDLVTSQTFDAFVMFVIVLIVIVMSCDYWGIEQDLETFALYNNAMLSFGMIYYVECVLKIVACGAWPLEYFTDEDEGAFNCFDFSVVVVGLFYNITAMRLLRLFKIMVKVPSLRVLTLGLVAGIKACSAIMLLLSLIMFLFAIEHLSRIARVLKMQGGGHALLAGVRGAQRTPRYLVPGPRIRGRTAATSTPRVGVPETAFDFGWRPRHRLCEI